MFFFRSLAYLIWGMFFFIWGVDFNHLSSTWVVGNR